jgi:hypothetical protein
VNLELLATFVISMWNFSIKNKKGKKLKGNDRSKNSFEYFERIRRRPGRLF